MSRFTRRRFLHSSLAAGAAFAISGTKSSGNILGSNERIRVAVAGVNGRGRSHLSAFARMQDVEIAYVVDPDSRLFDRTLKEVGALGGRPAAAVQDIREVLDDPSVHVVSIATPNHWHALMTVWACQAGKDVYVEKPCSHNVHEGRIALETARKYGRIVQHGTQSRSSESWARMTAAARSGKYGKLKVAYGYCYKPRGSIGFKKPEAPPSELDFNIWLGPAPEQPYHGNLVHYNWHWFWDTGNGDIGNQGVHEMDLARWGIGGTLPRAVVSLGGRFGYEDQGQTANTQVAVFDYGDAQLIFEVRGLKAERKVTSRFVTTEGVIEGGKFFPNGKDPAVSLDVEVQRRPGGGDHFANFIAAVRSRNPDELNADILEGHFSSALCHLANISYRLGQESELDPKAGSFRDNPAAADAYARMLEHLQGENGLKLAELKCRFGRRLEFDPRTERFLNDDQANALLTRKYRTPFVVPEKIA